jgi:uncharacterized protein (TIGR04255 family)
MSASVENAPVIEVIAELKWRPSILPEAAFANVGPQMILPPAAASTREFFARLASGVGALGYTKATPLVPEPFPLLVHQAALRFDAPNDGSSKSLYQVGPGLFSANAVPPYDSWSGSFSRTVEQGVQALLAARDSAERETPFEGATLRYLDAFGPALTEGRDSLAFTREILGITVDLPRALTQHLADGAAWKPFLQFHIPTATGSLLSVAIGDGMANDQPTILMDWSLTRTTPMPADVREVMRALNDAHDAIYASWAEMMKPISHLMPKKEQK